MELCAQFIDGILIVHILYHHKEKNKYRNIYKSFLPRLKQQPS